MVRARQPLVGLSLALLLGAVRSVCAAPANVPAPLPSIASGTLTSAFPSTGALLSGRDPETASSWCSGVMIGCQTFLTAAHCVCERNGSACQGAGAPRPDGRLVYLQHAGFFRIASIRVHPGFAFPVADVAVVRLTVPVTGITPSRMSSTPPPRVVPGVIVGFGRGGGSAEDYGLKRYGSVTTAPCQGALSSTTSVCWAFDGTGSNTCNGDSGGPLFIDLGDGPVVAGVTSGGRKTSCLEGDFDYDANVYRYRPWIEAQAGPDVGRRSCGAVPAAGETGAAILAFTGSLGPERQEGRHSFDVPAGMNELRIALHGVDDGESDFDLYVKAGSPPTTATYDCRASGPSQYSYCELLFPSGGTWHALAMRKSGAGTYQLTATIFGGDPPACGNDVRETGEECDGVDRAGCPGSCEPDCRCSNVCAGASLLPVKVRLGQRFMVKAVLVGSAGGYGGPDPAASGFSVTIDDGREPLRLAIPAGDPGWSVPGSPDGTYEWKGRTDGGRPVVLRCRRRPDGTWQIAVRGSPGADVSSPASVRPASRPLLRPAAAGTHR
jgi:hypothetical protein